ncbi:uncharacterized protein [Ptychodera flava]|uniref:uncharacterized protein n=1 Tax=Ptychodera flava TaxID=63121 RepID=UPI003969C674
MNRILAAKQAWRNKEREEVESAESKQSTESSMQADRTNGSDGSIDTDLLSSSNTQDGQLDTGENMQKECGSEAIAETRPDPNHSEVSENESSAPASLQNGPIATLRKRRGVTRPTDRQTRKRRKQNQEPDRASQSKESYTCEKTKESTLEMATSTTSGKWITVTLGTPVKNVERVALNTADTEGSNKFANSKSPVQHQQEALDNHDMDDLDPIMYLVRSAFPKEFPPEIEKIVHAFRLFDDGKPVDFVYREVEGTKRDVVRKWRGKYTLAKKKLKREQTVDKAEKKRTDKGKTHKIAPGRKDTSSVMSTEASVAPVVHQSRKVIATPRGGMRLRGKASGTQVSDVMTGPPSRVNTRKRRLPNENDSTQVSGKKPREEGRSASPHSAADVQNGRWAANTSGKELLDSQDMTSKTFHAQGRKTNNPKPVTRSTRSNARLQSSLPSRASTEVSTGLSSQIKAASNDDEHSGESVSKRDQALILLMDGNSVKQVAEKVGLRASTVNTLSNLLKTESVSKTERMKERYCHAEPRIHLKNCQPTGTHASIKSAASASRRPRHVRGLSAKTPCTIVGTTNCADASWDGILLITDKLSSLTGSLAFLKKPLEALKEVDAAVEKDVVVAPLGGNAAKRVVFAPTGPLNRDYDDVRRFGDAAGKGVKRGLKAGCKSLLLVVPGNKTFHEARLVAALGALHSLYVPLEVREAAVDRASKAEKLGIWAEDEEQTTRLCKLVEAMESGRLVARDIGGSDPERMAPVKVEEYVKELFKGSSVNISVISDPNVLDKDYPLHAAVDRCARRVDRHRGRIIEMEYKGEGNPDTTLLLVGKGVTYDTGGADIKHGGSMKGMHRDKCGAAAVAGFFQILALLQPKNIKVIGVLTLVRNSVGADSYVADEIITSRAGVRVRIGNTDAEGRMAMADPLCKMKDLALTEVNPHLYTIATLTGHAIRAMGPNYSIVLDNGPARKTKHAQELQTVGEDFGDPFEISSIRREDFEFHSGPSEYEDILQSNNAPSTMTARGHQSPAAFLIMVSGLDKHGVDSDKPLQYSHLDIAGSSGPFPGIPTGAPIVALAAKHLLSRI